MKATTWPKTLLRIAQRSLTGKPLNSSTEIRLTRLCTQRCRQCSIYERTTDPPSMSWEHFRIVAQRLRKYGATIGFISGGEPTLVPHLDRILMEAKKTFSVATTLVTGLVNKTETIRRIGRIALENDIHIQTSLDGFGKLGDDLRGVKDFSTTVLKHMEWLSKNRGASKSLLYANIVLNDLNLEQVPRLIRTANDIGWKTTVGFYHSLTETTRRDNELSLKPGKRLDTALDFLRGNPQILNLNTYIEGIADFVEGKPVGFCAFAHAPVLATRTTITEDGSVHLCYGGPIGNILTQPLDDIFKSNEYTDRIDAYRSCNGCWTTCYTQRYLLVHPRSVKELLQNVHKIRTLKAKS
ncbi:MAG: radical SAM protein [bacterium]